MGAAETTMEARLAAIMASLSESRELLASTLRRLEVKEPEGQVATTTRLMFGQDRVREKTETKPLSSSLISTHRDLAVGALRVDTILAPTMPTNCSAEGLAHYTDNGRAELVFPDSSKHLPATSSTLTRKNTVQGVRGTGMNSPAGWHELGAGARHVDAVASTTLTPSLPPCPPGVKLGSEVSLSNNQVVATSPSCTQAAIRVPGVQAATADEVFNNSPLKDMVWDGCWDLGNQDERMKAFFCCPPYVEQGIALTLPWDPGVWTIVAEIPELSTTWTCETSRLGQNLGKLPEDRLSMKLNEQLLLQVTQLATQIWDPGISRFAGTDWFCCYVILVCRGLPHALLRRTSQVLPQTSEKCYAFLTYYSLITTTTTSLYMEVTACRMQLLAAQWGQNQPERDYVPLPPFGCDILLGYYWEKMLDGKQSWNQNINNCQDFFPLAISANILQYRPWDPGVHSSVVPYQ